MQDLDLAVTAASAGADVVRRHWSGRAEVTYKGADNPVTTTDKAAEEAILAVLRAARPSDAIVAEEGGRGADSARRWFVDPLDGTVNFVSGIPQVGVSVALYDGAEPVAAAVIDVVREEVFTAVHGQGAFRDGNPIGVSDPASLAPAVIGTGFPYDHKTYAAAYAATLGAVLGEVQGIRRFGAASLDLAWVACGRLDGFFELDLAPWDTAAGLVLIREAGGVVTDPQGAAAGPFHPAVVAAGPRIHEALRTLVAENMPPHLRERVGGSR